MKKIKVSLILAAMLLLTACEKSPAVEIVPTSTPTPIPSLQEQTQLIMDKEDEWKLKEATEKWYYTITDLDHNGRYEVITAILQGTGLYTYADFYEVNETYDGLNKCSFKFEEGDSQADIIVDKCDCYYDEANDIYYYNIVDVMRIGMAQHSEAEYAVSLNGGKIEQKVIVSMLEGYDENKEAVIEYYDGQGNVVDKEYFDKAVEEFFKGMEKTEVQFQWTEVEPEVKNEIVDIMAADLYEGYGFYHTQCLSTGTYSFTASNSENVEWIVYVLDEEFNDAERFIGQAYDSKLVGNGTIEINQGQWLYVYCSCNVWTMVEAPEGCKFTYEIMPASDNGNGGVVTITKNPTSETIAIGGKTWFIAHAENANTIKWQFIDPNGKIYNIADTKAANPGLSLQELEGDTLAVGNVPQSLDEWSVQAVFSGANGTASTTKAKIFVSDYISSYASVINEYKSAIAGNYQGFYESTSLDQVFANACNADPSGVGFLTTSTTSLGYYLKDLNKDGLPELLIGATTSDYYEGCIIDLFTLQNGQPKRVLASSDRCRYYLRSDNMISCAGSGGASYSSNDLLKFNSNGVDLVNSVVLYGDDNGNINYYRVLDKDFDYSNDTLITQEEYESIEKEIHSSNIVFSVIPIA